MNFFFSLWSSNEEPRVERVRFPSAEEGIFFDNMLVVGISVKFWALGISSVCVEKQGHEIGFRFVRRPGVAACASLFSRRNYKDYTGFKFF